MYRKTSKDGQLQMIAADQYVFKMVYNGAAITYMSATNITLERLDDKMERMESELSFFMDTDLLSAAPLEPVRQHFVAFMLQCVIKFAAAFGICASDRAVLSSWLDWLTIDAERYSDWPLMSLARNSPKLMEMKAFAERFNLTSKRATSCDNILVLTKMWLAESKLASDLAADAIRMAPFTRGIYAAMKSSDTYGGWREILLSAIESPNLIGADSYFAQTIWHAYCTRALSSAKPYLEEACAAACETLMTSINHKTATGFYMMVSEIQHIFNIFGGAPSALALFRHILIMPPQAPRWPTMRELVIIRQAAQDKYFVDIDVYRRLAQWCAHTFNLTPLAIRTANLSPLQKFFYLIYAIIAYDGQLCMRMHYCGLIYGRNWETIVYTNLNMRDPPYEEFAADVEFEPNMEQNWHLQAVTYYYTVRKLFDELQHLLTSTELCTDAAPDFIAQLVPPSFPQNLRAPRINWYSKSVTWIGEREKGVNIFEQARHAGENIKSRPLRPQIQHWLNLASGSYTQ